MRTLTIVSVLSLAALGTAAAFTADGVGACLHLEARASAGPAAAQEPVLLAVESKPKKQPPKPAPDVKPRPGIRW